MSTVRTYIPEQVNLYISGILVEGFADGTVIEVKRNEQLYKSKSGIKGDITRTKNANKSGTIKFHLSQTSITNEKLSALVIADENAPAGTIVYPVMVKDLAGTSLDSSPDAWINGYPDTTYSKESSERVWEIECATLLRFIGGNS